MRERKTLRKAEILRGHGAFSRILAQGRTMTTGPLKCFYLVSPAGRSQLPLVGFSVSRSIHSAPARNRAKRLMREAFRNNKHLLSAENVEPTTGLTMLFLYTEKSDGQVKRTALKDIEQHIRQLLLKLSSILLSDT